MKNDIRKLDLNRLDLADENVQGILKEHFDKMITDGFGQMQTEGMLEIWWSNQMYYEGYQTPVGLSNDLLKEYVKKSKDIIDSRSLNTYTFRTKIDEENKIFFQDNKITGIIDGWIGDFTATKKTLQVKTDTNRKNNAIEKVTARVLEKHERDGMIWEQARIPAIEMREINGLGWTRTYFDPFENIPQGRIKIEAIHPCDVAVNPNVSSSRKKYFLDTDYVVMKKKMPYEEAIEFFANFGIDEEKVKPDGDYYRYGDEHYDTVKPEDSDYCTVYFIEYKRPAIEKIVTETGEIIRQRRMYYYKAVYNVTLGVIEHKINKYADPEKTDQWQFSLVPYYNKQSRLRVYPQSDIEKFKTVQDIINVMKSLMLNNARDGSKLRLVVMKQLQEKYPELWKTFEDFGGAFPIDPEKDGIDDVRKAVQQINVQELPRSFQEFLMLAEQSLKDQSVRHEALQGQFAERGNSNLSGVAISKMMEQNRKIGSYKETSTKWSVVQEARLIYNILAHEFTDEDWIEIQDAQKGDPKVIPVNKEMNLKEFHEFLTEEYEGMDLAVAADKFRQENDIKAVVPLKDEYGIPLQSIEEIEQLGEVYINFMRRPDEEGKLVPYDVEINIEFEWDTDRKLLEDRIIINEMAGNPEFMKSRTFRKKFLEIQGTVFANDADQILDEIDETNQATQLGMKVMELGLDQPVMAMVEQTIMAKQNNNKSQT